MFTNKMAKRKYVKRINQHVKSHSITEMYIWKHLSTTKTSSTPSNRICTNETRVTTLRIREISGMHVIQCRMLLCNYWFFPTWYILKINYTNYLRYCSGFNKWFLSTKFSNSLMYAAFGKIVFLIHGALFLWSETLC